MSKSKKAVRGTEIDVVPCVWKWEPSNARAPWMLCHTTTGSDGYIEGKRAIEWPWLQVNTFPGDDYDDAKPIMGMMVTAWDWAEGV